jgi:hypothetical protein
MVAEKAEDMVLVYFFFLSNSLPAYPGISVVKCICNSQKRKERIKRRNDDTAKLNDSNKTKILGIVSIGYPDDGTCI